ncbi:hypothetical protein F5880DRAFT_1510356 [Lentinula raphanica]|nr:hypothetical protein F5880DRAFT_1510356 [Lentinula raphanica]
MRLLWPTISVLALVCAVRTAPLTLPSHALSTSDLRVRANAEAYPSSPKHDLSTQREVSPSLQNARTQSTHQYAAVKRRSSAEALANDVALKWHLTGNFRSSNPTDQPPLPGPVLKWYTSCFRTIYPEASGSGGTPYDLIQPNVPRYQCPKLIAVTFPKGRGKKRKYSASPKSGEMPPREVELQVSRRLFGFPDYVEFIAFEGNYVQGETQFEYRVKDEDDDKRTNHKFSKPEPIDTPKDKGGKPPPCDFDTLMKEYCQRPRASKAGPSAAPSAGHRA